MNKHVLCQIEQEEFDTYELLLQNKATINTLRQIFNEKLELTEAVNLKLLEREKTINQSVSQWWEKITHKYNIPFFIGKRMFVDAENRMVYIREEKSEKNNQKGFY